MQNIDKMDGDRFHDPTNPTHYLNRLIQFWDPSGGEMHEHMIDAFVAFMNDPDDMQALMDVIEDLQVLVGIAGNNEPDVNQENISDEEDPTEHEHEAGNIVEFNQLAGEEEPQPGPSRKGAREEEEEEENRWWDEFLDSGSDSFDSDADGPTESCKTGAEETKECTEACENEGNQQSKKRKREEDKDDNPRGKKRMRRQEDLTSNAYSTVQ